MKLFWKIWQTTTMLVGPNDTSIPISMKWQVMSCRHIPLDVWVITKQKKALANLFENPKFSSSAYYVSLQVLKINSLQIFFFFFWLKITLCHWIWNPKTLKPLTWIRQILIWDLVQNNLLTFCIWVPQIKRL